MVDLFKRMFGKDASPAPSSGTEDAEPATRAAARADDARLAARRAQIASDLIELQQIAMAELALRREQDAAAGKAGFEADENDRAGHVLTV